MDTVTIGAVVQVPSGQGKGVVRFIGNTKFRAGTWIGVELENPNGKNDGEVQGVRYFTCARMYIIPIHFIEDWHLL